MSFSTKSSVHFCDHDNILLLDYAETKSKLIVETAVSEASLAESEAAKLKKFARSFLAYICDLHGKLTLRSIMTFLGLYVFLLSFQVIFQLEERLIRRPASPPKPFFRPEASKVVKDYYHGNGASPNILLRQSEIAVVFYYAPWSLESKQARPIYEMVARSFSPSPQLAFFAVNCFAAYGECRKTYRPHAFPIIVAYIGKLPLIYSREITPDALYSWISYLLKPMVRLTSRHEVGEFLARHDYSIIAYFSPKEVLKRGSLFRQYLVSSLFVAQYDDLVERTGFAVLTDSVTALYMRFVYDSQLRLYHWHRSKDYPQSRNYTGLAIAEWLREQTVDHQLVYWIVPDQSNLGKTEQLFTMLTRTPVVIMFTSREPLYTEQSEFSIVSQTALEYFSCSEDMLVNHRIRAVKREELRRQRPLEILRGKDDCYKLKSTYTTLFNCCHGIRESLDWLCHTCYFRDEPVNHLKSCYQCDNFHRRKRIFYPNTAECEIFFSHFSEETALTKCCSFISKRNKGFVASDMYGLSCEKYKLAQKMRYHELPNAFEDVSLPFDSDAIVGLSCNRNVTLRFAAVDVRQNDHWIKKLSLPTVNGTSVILIDSKTESLYLMRDNFSRKALRSIIRKFHKKVLDPYRITENLSKPISSKRDTKTLVKKTTAARFEADILSSQSGKDIMLFFSGGDWHGPSASVFYVYHTVAVYFKEFSDVLQFFMIDVSKNELPWPYKMEKVPAALLFPAKRKSASASFPASVPFTVPNLISFILAHSGMELRWRVALSSCSQLCLHRNKFRLRRYVATLMSDIGALQNLKKNYIQTHHKRLVEVSIRRRRAQLRVARSLLSVLRSLNALSRKEVQNEAILLARKSISLQSLLGYSYPQSNVVRDQLLAGMA